MFESLMFFIMQNNPTAEIVRKKSPVKPSSKQFPINPKTNSKVDRKTFKFSNNNIPKGIKNNPCNILPLLIVALIIF